MNQKVQRIRIPRRSNEAVGEIDPAERAQMVSAAAKKFEELFDILQLDYKNDHNMQQTPERVARMWVEELLYGRFTAPPTITDFENVERSDQMLLTGPIEVRSTCAHHLMPIYGQAFIGVLPSPEGKIIGLSKYDRIAQYFAARLQIQEELVAQIGSFIMETTRPRGLAIRMSAVHMCKTQRGVRAGINSRMVNTAFYGEFLSDPSLRASFLQECLALERNP